MRITPTISKSPATARAPGRPLDQTRLARIPSLIEAERDQKVGEGKIGNRDAKAHPGMPEKQNAKNLVRNAPNIRAGREALEKNVYAFGV
jgi:hypothetical protein